MDVQTGQAGRWQRAATLIAVGSTILFVGLLLGPTPGADPAAALRRIHDVQAWYVGTNVTDLLGLLVLTVGLFVASRLMWARDEAPVLGSAAGLLTLLAGGIMSIVLMLQSTLEPSIAARFVAADPTAQALQLAIGQTVLNLELGLFGPALAIEMAGLACFALALRKGAGPWVGQRFILVGLVLTVLAGLSGIGTLINALASIVWLEPVFSLLGLVWLALLGWLLHRAAAAPGADA